ncbi:Enoyl-CoA hydratase/isomerase family protein [Rhodovastum atsumiense]|nr:enoyl-CoA hydratase/isomerase family protein [Rhodovastum atsumiense]CAH2598903.1 Enoyl-CoA hydratase/isomerase family protein [Rhodovastum atsumiense]
MPETDVTPSMRIDFDASAPVATLTLCRSPMNAIDDAMLDALAGALEAVTAHAAITVLHLRSNQRVFCAGADLRMVAERVGSAAGAAAMAETVCRFHRVYDTLAALPVVTIAEINGAALGGGLELALACDLRIAGHASKLGLPEARVGLLPGAGGTQRLTRLCGPGVAARLILTGEAVDGREAERIGLVQWAAPDGEVADLAAGIATRAAGLSAEAVRTAKQCIGIAARLDPAGVRAEVEGITALMLEASTRQRVTDFLRK